MRATLIAIGLALSLPVVVVLGSWLAVDATGLEVLRHQSATVLPAYATQSALLALFVGVGVALMGGGAAAMVTLFEFPGRRSFEWLMLLPMAMPAYVLAYAYTDLLQYSGPLQTALRGWTGASGALWPDVRSLPGAVVLFVLCLYPYAYLLTRAALGERGVQMMEAARLLGAGMKRRVLEIAVPMARPALAAGIALALMETLADYGVGSYFGLATFTTGIYKAWLGMNDRVAAAQLASLLLAVVALLLWFERRAQRRLRFATSRPAHNVEARPLVLGGRGALVAWMLCGVPVLFGFAIPMLVLARMLWIEAASSDIGLPLERFLGWCWVSFKLASLAALVATALALALGFALRRYGQRARVLGAVTPTVSLSYAVPGAVIAVGILLPVGWLQSLWPGVAGIVTGSLFGLLYAYLVRFSAVALQSVESGYARVPASIDESARMLGASAPSLFFELHAPLLKRSALAAVLLVFVDVMKELPATLVLRPFDSDTLAVVAYNLARDERLGEAALPSLAIVVVGLIPVVLLTRAMRR